MFYATNETKKTWSSANFNYTTAYLGHWMQEKKRKLKLSFFRNTIHRENEPYRNAVLFVIVFCREFFIFLHWNSGWCFSFLFLFSYLYHRICTLFQLFNHWYTSGRFRCNSTLRELWTFLILLIINTNVIQSFLFVFKIFTKCVLDYRFRM